MIFNWFKEDWTSGYRGFDGKTAPVTSLEEWFGRYASLLAENPEQQKLVREGKTGIRHLDYDWSLNDAKK